jgi:hypothetical protein
MRGVAIDDEPYDGFVDGNARRIGGRNAEKLGQCGRQRDGPISQRGGKQRLKLRPRTVGTGNVDLT